MLTRVEYRELLRHRYPILLVDRVVELVAGERITAIKAVTFNEPWYQRLAPGTAESAFAYPQAMLLEAWGQAGGILAARSRPAGTGDGGSAEVMLFGGVREVTFGRKVFPGDVITQQVRMFGDLNNTMFFEGESLVDDEIVLTVKSAVMALRPQDQLGDELAALG